MHGDTLFVTHATSGQTSGLSIDPVIVFPHANWRGDYTVGTYEGGRTSWCRNRQTKDGKLSEFPHGHV